MPPGVGDDVVIWQIGAYDVNTKAEAIGTTGGAPTVFHLAVLSIYFLMAVFWFCS